MSPQSKQQLDTIADGIKLSEGALKVVVEGHTDAKSRAIDNDKLSLRRATAVRDYLVRERKLQARLLMVEGCGSQKLLDKADPYSARNRRVQFRAGDGRSLVGPTDNAGRLGQLTRFVQGLFQSVQ